MVGCQTNEVLNDKSKHFLKYEQIGLYPISVLDILESSAGGAE